MKITAFSLLLLIILYGIHRNDVSGEPGTSSIIASSTPKPVVHNEVLDVGFMYWAPPRPILAKEWRLVIGGTVLETHKSEGSEVHPEMFTSGTINVEKIFFNQPTRDVAVGSDLKRFKSDLFNGLKKGDRVIVFVNEYDGGYGIIDVPDSNCRIGIKVKNWDEPIVGAIELMIKKGAAMNLDPLRKQILADAAYAAIWRKYSSKGLDYLLKDKPYYR